MRITRLSLAGGLGFLCLGVVLTLLLAVLGSLLWGSIPYWPTAMLINLSVMTLGWWGLALAALWPVAQWLIFPDSPIGVFLPVNVLQPIVFLAGVHFLRVDTALRSLDDRLKYLVITAGSSVVGAVSAWLLFHAFDAHVEPLDRHVFLWTLENVIPALLPGIWLHGVVGEAYRIDGWEQGRKPVSWMRRTVAHAVPWMATLLVVGAMLVVMLVREAGADDVSLTNATQFWDRFRQEATEVPALRYLALALMFAILYSLGSAIQHAKQSWTLVEAVRRHLPNRRLSELLTGGAALPTEQRLVTVMFTDLRGFTETSAKFEPGDLVTWLNAYFTHMGGVCEKYGASIDKFIGDGIMVVFGLQSPDAQARQAVLCALDMLDELERWQAEGAAAGFPTVMMGIGIHSGIVIAGEIGSPQRRQYTVIGSVVNTAARLEAASKEVPAGALPIVMSNEAARHAGLLIHPAREEILVPMKVHLKGVTDMDQALSISAAGVAQIRGSLERAIAPRAA